MSGWGANVNGCLSYTACSYQPTEVMTLCIHAERRTSCDQLGYGVMNASRFDFILGRRGEALEASAAGHDDFVFEFS